MLEELLCGVWGRWLRWLVRYVRKTLLLSLSNNEVLLWSDVLCRMHAIQGVFSLWNWSLQLLQRRTLWWWLWGDIVWCEKCFGRNSSCYSYIQARKSNVNGARFCTQPSCETSCLCGQCRVVECEQGSDCKGCLEHAFLYYWEPESYQKKRMISWGIRSRWWKIISTNWEKKTMNWSVSGRAWMVGGEWMLRYDL